MSTRELMALALVAGLVACGEQQAGRETGQVGGEATDTVVTERTVQDTALVTYDTNVNVDTATNQGERGVGESDTVLDTRPEEEKQTRPGMGQDTAAVGGDTATLDSDTIPRP